MRIPSRRMPTYDETLTWKSKSIGYGIVIFLLLWLGYGIWQDPQTAFIFVGIIAIIFVLGYFTVENSTKYFEVLYRKRAGEDIGTFARSLDYKNTDTWIIRAVYEEINSELPYDKTIPLHPSDNLKEDLKLDDEDLEFVLERIFARAGISDEAIEKNPYYTKMDTVADLVAFCDYQPKENRLLQIEKYTKKIK